MLMTLHFNFMIGKGTHKINRIEKEKGRQELKSPVILKEIENPTSLTKVMS